MVVCVYAGLMCFVFRKGLSTQWFSVPRQWLFVFWGGGGLVNLRHRKLCSSTVLGQIYDLVSQLLISGAAHHFLSFLFENW